MSEPATSMQELKSEITNLKGAVEEIRTSQIKIAHALLGGFEKDSAGLLEQQRINVASLIELKAQNVEIKEELETQASQISELEQFKSEIKKVVALIAFAIPIVFEILKAIAEVAWEAAKAHFFSH